MWQGTIYAMSKKREKRRKWKKCFLHLQTLIKNNVEIFLAPDMSDVQGWLIARKSFFPFHVSQEKKTIHNVNSRIVVQLPDIM